MGLEVSKFGRKQGVPVQQEFPLRGTAAILAYARSKGRLQPQPQASAQTAPQTAPQTASQVTAAKIQTFMPNEVIALIGSYVHPFERDHKGVGTELYKVLGIENQNVKNISHTAANFDSLEVQQREVERLLSDYRKNPKLYPLPFNTRVYTAPVCIKLRGKTDGKLEVIQFLSRACPNMKSLVLSSELTDEMVDVLVTCKNLQHLALSKGIDECTVEKLPALCTLTGLTSLVLKFPIKGLSTEIAQKFLDGLSALKELTCECRFDANDESIDNQEIKKSSIDFLVAALKSCPGLESLSLPDTFFADFLGKVNPLLKLKKLVMTQENEESFQPKLTTSAKMLRLLFPQLEELTIPGTVSPEALLYLQSSCPHLHSLHFLNALTGDCLPHLGNFKELTKLTFTCSDDNFSADDMRKLALDLTHLQSLTIFDVPDELVPAVGSFVNLEELSIRRRLGSAHYDSFSDCFAPLRNLRKLHFISNRFALGPEDSLGLSAVSTNIEELRIQLPYYTQRVVRELMKFQQLKRVELVTHLDHHSRKTLYIDEVIKQVAPYWKELTQLSIITTYFELFGKNLGDLDYTSIVDDHGSLKRLYFKQNPFLITQTGLDALSSIKKLQYLICDLNNIKKGPLKEFIQTHPTLQVVNDYTNMRGCFDSKYSDLFDSKIHLTESGKNRLTNTAGEHARVLASEDHSDHSDGYDSSSSSSSSSSSGTEISESSDNSNSGSESDS